MKRVWRGLVKMTEVFGIHFVVAIAGTVALLLYAIAHMHGPLAAIAGLILALMGIRAHDFEDDEPTEVDAEYDYLAGTQWTEKERLELLQQRKSLAEYNHNVITVLGQNREGTDL